MLTRFVATMLWRALALACVSFVAIPLTQNAWLLGVISFVIGLGMGCGQPVMMTLAYNRSPAGRSGEVAGLRLMANNVIELTKLTEQETFLNDSSALLRKHSQWMPSNTDGFIISADRYTVYDPAARQAHYVLPAKSLFEEEDLVTAYWHPYLQWRAKILPTPGEVRPETEIYRGPLVETKSERLPEGLLFLHPETSQSAKPVAKWTFGAQAVEISAHAFSATATKKIESAGGRITNELSSPKRSKLTSSRRSRMRLRSPVRTRSPPPRAPSRPIPALRRRRCAMPGC